MEIGEALAKLGLTKNEIKAYLTLLDLGAVSAGKISKISEIHRRPTYDALTRLLDKGLFLIPLNLERNCFKQLIQKDLFLLFKKKKQQ